MLDERPDLDTFVVPLGGGGLLSGTAIVARARGRDALIVGAEAAASPVFTAALAAGRPVTVEVAPTLADGLAGNMEPDSQTFAHRPRSRRSRGDGRRGRDRHRHARPHPPRPPDRRRRGRRRRRGAAQRPVSTSRAAASASFCPAGTSTPNVIERRAGAGRDADRPCVPISPCSATTGTSGCLWLGQVVSQLGDWFNYVALYALLFELTGSATAVAC